MTTTHDRPYHVIGRGFNGWHAVGINVRSSGGDLENGTYWTGAPTTGYRFQCVPDALIYDASEAEYSVFARLVISGPMVDPALAPDAGSRFGDRETAARMAPGLSGDLQTVAMMAAAPTYGGLDTVGVNIYRDLLSRVPGIKIGRIDADGTVIWQDDDTR
jgi:hypothetical protein